MKFGPIRCCLRMPQYTGPLAAKTAGVDLFFLRDFECRNQYRDHNWQVVIVAIRQSLLATTCGAVFRYRIRGSTCRKCRVIGIYEKSLRPHWANVRLLRIGLTHRFLIPPRRRNRKASKGLGDVRNP
jgi:hypothetical protein